MSESFELKREDLSKKVEGEVQGDSVEKENKEVVDSEVIDSQLEELKEKDAIESSAKVDALLQEMSFQTEKMTRGQFQQALENATTLEHIVEALEGFAVNGEIESNSPSGAINLQKAIDAINGGYGGNISDSHVQRAVRRIEEENQGESGIEKMTRSEFEQALENATTIDQIVETVEGFAVDGKVQSNSPAGDLDLVKTVRGIKEGYGSNVSDSHIQRAVMRVNEQGVENETLAESGAEKMTRGEFEQALASATTLEQVVEALEEFAEDGAVQSNSPAGKLSLGKMVDAIREGYGRNISDSHIQNAIVRIEGIEE